MIALTDEDLIGSTVHTPKGTMARIVAASVWLDFAVCDFLDEHGEPTAADNVVKAEQGSDALEALRKSSYPFRSFASQ